MAEVLDTATARRPQIIEAATGIFLRYGYERTTMADIAKASGVSRPTLYSSFSDKERIYRAVLETMAAEKLAELQQGLAVHEDLEGRLHYACETWTIQGYELVRGNPDAKDLFDLAIPVVRETHAAFEEFLTGLLAGTVRVSAHSATPRETARMINAALKGFKDLASDADELRGMIRGLTGAVTAALAAKTRRPGHA